MRNNLYICNANPQTKTTLTSHISGSNFGTHYKRLLYQSMGVREFRYFVDYNIPYESSNKPYMNGLRSGYRYTKLFANREGELYIYPENNHPAKVYAHYHTHPRNGYESNKDLKTIFYLGVQGVILGWNGCVYYYKIP